MLDKSVAGALGSGWDDCSGAGMGVYLLVRSTQVLVLRGPRVTTLPPFYLDAHGEEDPYLRR